MLILQRSLGPDMNTNDNNSNDDDHHHYYYYLGLEGIIIICGIS